MSNPIARLFNLQSGDGRRGALLFAYLFLIITCYQMAKSARDALFLDVFKASKLPYADMAIAITAGVVFALYVTIGRRLALRNLLVGSLLLFAAMDCGFWYLARFRPELIWQFPVFYIFVGIFGVLAPTQVWTLANYILTTREAKRIFGLVGAGAITGWIFAGFLTKALASIEGLGTESLLLAKAIGLALCAGLVIALWRQRGQAAAAAAVAAPHAEPGSKSLRESLGVIFSSPYLISIASLITLSSVATTFAGWQFKAIAKAAYQDKDALTAFFGTFNFWAGLACLALQLLVTTRFLRRFGLGAGLLIVPVALFAGELAVYALGTLAAVVLLKGSDQLLRYSVDKSSVELLYLPIAPEVKLQAKSCIDTFIWRVGDGVAGFTLAIFADRLAWSAQKVSLVNVVFIGAWIATAVVARRKYASRLLESIRERRLDVERQLAPVLDRSTNDILAEQLRSTDPKQVLYALEVFGVAQRQAPHPAVRELLGHDQPAVRKRAIEALDTARDLWALPKVEEMLHDPDLGVRTAALLFLSHHAHVDPLTRIEELKDFPDYSIESAMAAFLAQPGEAQNLVAARLLMDRMIGHRGETGKSARLEAAELVGILPDAFDAQLDALLADEAPEVVAAAARAAGKLGKARAAPKLLALLADASTREGAADALAAMGDGALDTLRAALRGDGGSPGRLEVPALLARIGTQAAANTLAESLLEGDPELRFRIISALNELRRDRPQTHLEPRRLHAALALEMMLHCRTSQILSVASRSEEIRHGEKPPTEVLQRLEESREREIERIFRTLSLLYPETDFRTAHYGLRSIDPTARDHAVEFLDMTLDSDLRRTLVPLLDPSATLEDRVAPIMRRTGMEMPTRAELVAALVESSDPWLKVCGLSAVGALGLRELAGEVEAHLDAEDDLLRQTARAAKQRLAAQPT